MFDLKIRRLLNSNHGHLGPEATALPTEPQPLSKAILFFVHSIVAVVSTKLF